jgi:hypothetical protein
VCGISCHAGFANCSGNPADGCQALNTYFVDADHDGYGTTATTTACAPPAGYAPVSGDCDDTNSNVHPGQTTYFGTPYTLSGAISYDYNCDGVETPDPGSIIYTTCGADCSGEGYLNNSPFRSGSGINNHCGSTNYETCIPNGPVSPCRICLPTCTRTPTTSSPLGCR